MEKPETCCICNIGISTSTTIVYIFNCAEFDIFSVIFVVNTQLGNVTEQNFSIATIELNWKTLHVFNHVNPLLHQNDGKTFWELNVHWICQVYSTLKLRSA